MTKASSQSRKLNFIKLAFKLLHPIILFAVIFRILAKDKSKKNLNGFHLTDIDCMGDVATKCVMPIINWIIQVL